MPSDAIEAPGRVLESFRGDRHRVEVDVDGRKILVLAKRCGRLVSRFVRVLPGDAVVVEICPYDPARGRIVRRS